MSDVVSEIPKPSTEEFVVFAYGMHVLVERLLEELQRVNQHLAEAVAADNALVAACDVGILQSITLTVHNIAVVMNTCFESQPAVLSEETLAKMQEACREYANTVENAQTAMNDAERGMDSMLSMLISQAEAQKNQKFPQSGF